MFLLPTKYGIIWLVSLYTIKDLFRHMGKMMGNRDDYGHLSGI